MRKTLRLSAKRQRWWRAAMHPHRLDRAAWAMIAEFERGLDRQMNALRDWLIEELADPPAKVATVRRKMKTPQPRSTRKK